MPTPGVTTGLDSWNFQDHYVERLLDNAAYTSAHPDDTLLLAGPARFNGGKAGENFTDNLMAIGMVQGFSASQAKPIQPLMSIGSGRQFYVSGKAQTSWSIQRLFVNGRNLLRVLNTQAVKAGINVAKFDDPSAYENASQEQFWVNLDSELFLIPFGLAIFFRDKVHNKIGAFYMELCVIQSWQISLNAGGNMIAEAVSGVADRVLPIYPNSFPGTSTAGDAAIPGSTLDQTLGLSSDTTLASR